MFSNGVKAQRQNVRVGCEAIFNHHIASGDFTDFGHASNVGGGFMLEKSFTHYLDGRLLMAIPGISTRKGFDRYGKGTIDVKFNLLGAINGYDAKRSTDIYFVAGAGFAGGFNVEEGSALSPLLEVGLGISQRLGKDFNIFVEYLFENIGTFSFNHLHQQISLGFQYRIK